MRYFSPYLPTTIQKATEMEKDVTDMQTLENLYEDMSQDNPENKLTSSVISHENDPEQKQSEKVVEPFKRKVSIMSPLTQISEEEDGSYQGYCILLGLLLFFVELKFSWHCCVLL